MLIKQMAILRPSSCRAENIMDPACERNTSPNRYGFHIGWIETANALRILRHIIPEAEGLFYTAVQLFAQCGVFHCSDVLSQIFLIYGSYLFHHNHGWSDQPRILINNDMRYQIFFFDDGGKRCNDCCGIGFIESVVLNDQYWTTDRSESILHFFRNHNDRFHTV